MLHEAPKVKHTDQEILGALGQDAPAGSSFDGFAPRRTRPKMALDIHCLGGFYVKKELREGHR